MCHGDQCGTDEWQGLYLGDEAHYENSRVQRSPEDFPSIWGWGHSTTQHRGDTCWWSEAEWPWSGDLSLYPRGWPCAGGISYGASGVSAPLHSWPSQTPKRFASRANPWGCHSHWNLCFRKLPQSAASCHSGLCDRNWIWCLLLLQLLDEPDNPHCSDSNWDEGLCLLQVLDEPDNPKFSDSNWEQCFQQLPLLHRADNPKFSDRHWIWCLLWLQLFDEPDNPKFSESNWTLCLQALQLFNEPDNPKFSDSNWDRSLFWLQLLDKPDNPHFSDSNWGLCFRWLQLFDERDNPKFSDSNWRRCLPRLPLLEKCAACWQTHAVAKSGLLSVASLRMHRVLSTSGSATIRVVDMLDVFLKCAETQ